MENDTVRSRLYAGVKGSTVVNHKLRIYYCLSYPEYVILDYIHGYQEKFPGKPIEDEKLFRATGYHTGVELTHIVSLLLDKGLIQRIATRDDSWSPECTKEWLKNFDTPADFEEFWKLWGKVGNKQKSIIMYVRARKVVDKETLHAAAEKFVKSSTERFGEVSMHASSYLNPKNKHWEDNIVEKKAPPTKQDQAGRFNIETF